MGSLLGVAIAHASDPAGIEERIEAAAGAIFEASSTAESGESISVWARPKKTQTRTQWVFIAKVAKAVTDLLEVDVSAASNNIRGAVRLVGGRVIVSCSAMMSLPGFPNAVARASIETVYSHPGISNLPEGSWWARYGEALDGFTDTSRAVLEADCRYIVDRGIFGAGAPSATTWPQSRVRRGLVMGSVQSGKTASMLGA